MSLVNRSVLTALITTALELHEPGEGGGEYTRGQSNLIGDVCDIPSDVRDDVLHPMLYQVPRRTPDDITDIVLKATEVYRS
jgi:hypothetical protein